jgi:HSP20 family protein
MAQTFGPLLEAARIQSEINRLFDNLLDLGTPGKDAGSWIPNIDMSETEESLVLRAELPGVQVADLKLYVHGGNVILQGEKARPATQAATPHALVSERLFGPFRRVIHLTAPVNTHRAEATLVDGLLRIRFPKVPNRRGEEVRIEVKAP